MGYLTYNDPGTTERLLLNISIMSETDIILDWDTDEENYEDAEIRVSYRKDRFMTTLDTPELCERHAYNDHMRSGGSQEVIEDEMLDGLTQPSR